MSLELYYSEPSVPCRSVLLLSKALGVSPELKSLNVLENEQFSEEYLQMNPQHTIPLLVDDGFALSESRAILMYLVENYSEDDSLYPKEGKERAIVNQRLFFDMGTLSSRLVDCYLYPVFWQKKGINENLIEKVEEAFNILNTYLEGHDWVAGDQITIADYSTVVTVSTAEGIGVDLSQYPNVADWLQRCKDSMEGYEEINQSGLNTFLDIYNEKLSQVEA